MNARMISMVALMVWGTSGLAQETIENPMNSTNSCVIVYVKNDNSQPNLTIACDGERVLTHIVKTEKQLEDPTKFKAELFLSFQTLINSDGKKKCKQYDLDGVWWASCIR